MAHTKYRKVAPRFWLDDGVVSLSAEQKLLALYCLTSRQTNRIGFFSFSLAMAAEDLGRTDELTSVIFEDLDRVCHALSWAYDKRCRVLYLPNWWNYNQPYGPKQAAGFIKDLDELPATPLLRTFWEAKNLPVSLKTHKPDTLLDTQSYTVSDTRPIPGAGAGAGKLPCSTKVERPRVDESQVESLWKAFPKKVGKKRALPHIRAALLKYDFEFLLAAVNAYAALGLEHKYILHPERWFRDERFNDEALKTKKAKPFGYKSRQQIDQEAEWAKASALREKERLERERVDAERKLLKDTNEN